MLKPSLSSAPPLPQMRTCIENSEKFWYNWWSLRFRQYSNVHCFLRYIYVKACVLISSWRRTRVSSNTLLIGKLPLANLIDFSSIVSQCSVRAKNSQTTPRLVNSPAELKRFAASHETNTRVHWVQGESTTQTSVHLQRETSAGKERCHIWGDNEITVTQYIFYVPFWVTKTETKSSAN